MDTNDSESSSDSGIWEKKASTSPDPNLQTSPEAIKKPESFGKKVLTFIKGLVRCAIFILCIAVWVNYGFWVFCFVATCLFSLFSLWLFALAFWGFKHNKELRERTMKEKREIAAGQILCNIPIAVFIGYAIILIRTSSFTLEIMEHLGKIGFALVIIMISIEGIVLGIAWMKEEAKKRNTTVRGLIKIGFGMLKAFMQKNFLSAK